MDKEQMDERQEALKQVHGLIAQHHFTADELGVAPTAHTTTVVQSTVSKQNADNKPHLTIAETFYNIGAVVILSGAWAFVGVSWSGLDNAARIFISLMVVGLTYASAVLASKAAVIEKVAPALYFATVATVPIVMIAILHAFDAGMDATKALLYVALFSGAFSFAGWFFHKLPIFTLGAIVYSTLVYIALYQMYADTLLGFEHVQTLAVTAYTILGGLYWLAAYLSGKFIRPLAVFKEALYGFGALFIFGALFTETGWSGHTVTVLGVLYPLIILGGVILSAMVKQPVLLIMAALFLIIYLVKTTFVYFSDNHTWPVALILSGMLTVAVGIGANLLAKRFGMMKSKA